MKRKCSILLWRIFLFFLSNIVRKLGFKFALILQSIILSDVYSVLLSPKFPLSLSSKFPYPFPLYFLK